MINDFVYYFYDFIINPTVFSRTLRERPSRPTLAPEPRCLRRSEVLRGLGLGFTYSPLQNCVPFATSTKAMFPVLAASKLAL